MIPSLEIDKTEDTIQGALRESFAHIHDIWLKNTRSTLYGPPHAFLTRVFALIALSGMC